MPALNPIYKNSMMHGRPVILLPVSQENDEAVCADCYGMPQYIVQESDGVLWHWCGQCDIGG